MKKLEVWQKEILYATPVYTADSFFGRFKGWMMRKDLIPGEGLLLKNCPAIHGCFMRFPIDAIYLDGNMNVLGMETLRPWHLGSIIPGTRHVLELADGRSDSFKKGMHLEFKEWRIHE